MPPLGIIGQQAAGHLDRQLQRDIRDRQADGIIADHLHRPELLQEEQLEPVEENGIDDELDRQDDGGGGEIFQRDPAPVAPRQKDRQRGEKQHQLAERITDENAFDAIEDGADGNAGKLHDRDGDRQLKEGAKLLFADQVEFDEGTDRLDEEQHSRDQSDDGAVSAQCIFSEVRKNSA